MKYHHGMPQPTTCLEVVCIIFTKIIMFCLKIAIIALIVFGIYKLCF